MPILDAETFEAGGWQQSFAQGAALPFADESILAFLSALSRAILSDREARSYPDLATFGYFCRKANLARAIADVVSAEERFGWGTILHIAPANIPLNFAFSFVMGLLSGNSNLVRMPSRRVAQTNLCVDIIDRVLADPAFTVLARSNLFVQTHRDSTALTGMVAEAEGLVVWGGDTTVQRFRALPKAPRCIEIYFPDRVSSLMVDAAGYLAMDDEDARLSARHFFNDSFLVDQNACSSPTTIFWLGDDAEIIRAKERFWSLLVPILQAEYTLDPVARINRTLDIFRDVSAVGHALHLKMDHDVWRVEDPAVLGLPLRFGTFLELSIRKVAEALDYLRTNEQTLTTLGIAPAAVFRQLTSEGKIPVVDRIVPVGQALDIGFLWDGREVLSVLSRRIQIS